MTSSKNRIALTILFLNGALGLLCISGCKKHTDKPSSGKDTKNANKKVVDQKQKALQEPGKELPGESVTEFNYANKTTFLPGKDVTITSIERRNTDDGKMTIIARCDGTKKQKVMLLVSYTYSAGQKNSSHIAIGSEYESQNGKFAVASRGIDVSNLSGTGHIHVFLMPYDNYPKWLIGDKKQEVVSISNLFKASITFGATDDPASNGLKQ